MFSLLDPSKWTKGEGDALKTQLESGNVDSQMVAVRKLVVQAMHGNVPTEFLFTDVLKLAPTDNLKLKKLVFYYLSLTAKHEPELAMLTVNTLVLSLKSHIPFVRSLAIRTATNMGLHDLWEHLTQQFHECLREEDPYVRKTAVLSIAKFYAKRPSWVEDVGFINQLTEMLFNEDNACVLVNVVAALADMGQLVVTTELVKRLLTAMSETHEWGRIKFLEVISTYIPESPTAALKLCDRITQYLTHSNASVVMTTIKVIVPLLDVLPSEKDTDTLLSKIGGPLKSLLSCEPALQYVAMRNIRIILQKYPGIFLNDVRPFFVKYNDAIFVKMEKVDILVKLSSPKNIVLVLSELEEYAKEADVDFVRTSVLAVGRCAIKDQRMADMCVKTLLTLLENDVTYVVETILIAFRDIFRRYPKQYEQTINRLSDRLERIEDPEARGAFIWMVGEYAAFITDADVHLENFMADFTEEDTMVQQALLTAIVKLFLTLGSPHTLVQDVLEKAVNVDNPDLRDRAYIYWRLLSTHPAVAKEVVMADKPPILSDGDAIAPALMDTLLTQIGTLASVYHKLPSAF